MCTRILWDQTASIQAIAVARVMDLTNWHKYWREDRLGVDMWVLPAKPPPPQGASTAEPSKAGAPANSSGGETPDAGAATNPPGWKTPKPRSEAGWTSKYGSLVVGARWREDGSDKWVGISLDGVNEKLLCGQAMAMSGTNYPAPGGRPVLGAAMWLQYYLDNFASVEEAIACPVEEVLSVQGFKVLDIPTPLHLTLEDPSGASALIEFPAAPHRHHWKPGSNPPALPPQPVVTNFLTCEKATALLQRYEGQRLPGGDDDKSRFVRAKFHFDRLPRAVENKREMLAYLLSIARNVSQPFGREGGPEIVRPTWWRTLAFLHEKNPAYYFESTVGPNLIWVDIKKLMEGGKFAAGQPVLKLGLTDEDRGELDRVGDVTDEFQAEQEFHWPV